MCDKLALGVQLLNDLAAAYVFAHPACGLLCSSDRSVGFCCNQSFWSQPLRRSHPALLCYSHSPSRLVFCCSLVTSEGSSATLDAGFLQTLRTA